MRSIAHSFFVLLSVLLSVAVSGCTSLATSDRKGSEGGPCFANGTCDGELSCRSNLCVLRTVKDGGGDDGDDSDSDDAASGAGHSGAGAGKGGAGSSAVDGGAGNTNGGASGGSAGSSSAGSGPIAGAAGGNSGGMGGIAGGSSMNGGMGGGAGMSPPTGVGAGGTTGGSSSCESAVMTSDPTTTAQCAACLCTNCASQLNAMTGDTKAQTLSTCGRTNECSGNCCFCDSAVCTMDNHRAGPCAAETEMAAGVPSPSDFVSDGLTLMNACGAAGNSCNKALALATCSKSNCPTQCPAVAACN